MADLRRPANTPEQTTVYEKLRIRTAAHYITQLYPGPIGLIVARELDACAEFGYRLGVGSLITLAVDQAHREWKAKLDARTYS